MLGGKMPFDRLEILVQGRGGELIDPSTRGLHSGKPHNVSYQEYTGKP